MADFSGDPGLWAARMLGASAGSAVSLVYMLPAGRREAASRFLTGLACGLIFGGPTGLWLAQRLGLGEALGSAEIMLTGSAAASLMAWWGLGALVRVAGKWGR